MKQKKRNSNEIQYNSEKIRKKTNWQVQLSLDSYNDNNG